MTTLLDCGHLPTRDTGVGTGSARTHENRTVCYQCAADIDREYAGSMTPSDPPLLAYLRPSPDGFRDASNRVKIITWAGIELGRGFGTDPKQDSFGHLVQYVTCTIDGRRFYGRHYSNSGDYIGLRPYKGQ